MDNIINVTAVSDIHTRWLVHLENQSELSDASRDTYTQGVDNFLAWLQIQHEPLSPALLERWKTELLVDKRVTTVNTWLSAVRKFFDWATSQGLQADPTEGVRNVERAGANTAHLRDALTDEEILLLLDLPNHETDIGVRDYAYLCIKAFTGLRDVEMHRADYDDLSLVNGIPVLRIHGKGRKETDRVAVIYNQRAQDALSAWLALRGHRAGALFTSFSNRSNGERLGLRAIRKTIRTYLLAAGIDSRRKTSHSIRHSALTKIAVKNLLKAQEVAGHSDTRTTLIYVHEADRISHPGESLIDYTRED